MNDVLAHLFRELVDGPPGRACYVLNPGDAGLLRSLDRLTAEQASRIPPGSKTSVAAHVDHLRYGLSLGNQWAAGDPNPFATANFRESWKKTTVNEDEWTRLRGALRKEIEAWSRVLQQELPENEVARNGIGGSVVHLAYHLGAIRQLAPELAGPSAND